MPFREQRLCGIVTELHDREPDFTVKRFSQMLDTTPALTPELMELGRWIAQYYIAPVGEVFRTMLPLSAEFRRVIGYRITDKGIDALHAASTVGSSLRSRKEPEHQMLEYAVLNRLSDGEVVREGNIALGLGSTTRRIADDGAQEVDCPRRLERCSRRQPHDSDRHTESRSRASSTQTSRRSSSYLRRQDGQKAPVDAVRELAVPRTTLQTLVKRGIVELSEEAAAFRMSGHEAAQAGVSLYPCTEGGSGRRSISSVDQRKFLPMLLHGVTGSGKTAVYLSAMQAVLAKGRSAILLVPEIGLTPAMAADLHQIFGDEVAILHSGLSDDERAEQWKRIRNGESHIVVGTRSAIFAPVPNLSLIVVDEEHDHSYKQEEMPRYHARDVAVMRAKMSNAAVVLGSATPSLETYYNALQGKYRLLELPERIEKRPLPEVEILDMREEFQRTKKDEALSRKLVEEIGERLERHEQVMVLLNRRGYSAFVLCRECGESMQCKNCAISMTYHKREHRLVCHYCGYMRPAPKTCPKCGSEFVQYLGTGSEKLEHILHGLFPQARISRLDRDTVRGRDDFERMLTALQAGEIDLLVGHADDRQGTRRRECHAGGRCRLGRGAQLSRLSSGRAYVPAADAGCGPRRPRRDARQGCAADILSGSLCDSIRRRA